MILVNHQQSLPIMARAELINIGHENHLRSRSRRVANPLTDAPIEESDEETPGVILDFDESGQVIGFEILNALSRVENPRSVEWTLAA